MLKYCNICKKEKDENEFHTGRMLERNHKNLYEFCCLECFNKLQEEEKEKRQKELERKSTTTTKCKKCGETKLLIDMKNKKYCKKCVEENPELINEGLPKEYIQISEKECCTCHKVKSVDEFSKCNSKKDGYMSKCKDCAKEYNVKHRAANHEKYLEDKRNAYNNDPDRLEKASKIREENREKIRAYDREYSRKRRANEKSSKHLI